jgi:hypothetical protein
MSPFLNFFLAITNEKENGVVFFLFYFFVLARLFARCCCCAALAVSRLMANKDRYLLKRSNDGTAAKYAEMKSFPFDLG